MSSVDSSSSDCPWWALKYYYQATDCSDTPIKILIEPTVPSEGSECSVKVDGSSGQLNTSAECAANSEDWSAYLEQTATEYNYPYLLVTTYQTEGCSDLQYGDAYVADGRCQVFINSDSQKATVTANGEATYQYYSSSMFCTGDPDFTLTTTNVSNTSDCGQQEGVYNGYTLRLFSPTSTTASPDSTTSTSAPTSTPTTTTPTTTDSSDSSTTPIALGVAVAAVLLVALVVLAWFCLKKRRPNSQMNEPLLLPSATGLWNDPVIIAARLPRDKLQVHDLLSRGGYGEVYLGAFDDQLVAVKMLLPVHRNDLEHVNSFLAEAKLTASLEHPRIVQLVGVAWNSFKDLCVVLEFADNGDLRAFLEKLHNDQHPVGFDTDKVKIALHVSHALTYLHSLDQPVLHRDLKSRNILLNKDLDAKVTDFGASRKIATETMTTGIGSSLWMAPEVMIGGKYNEKADMFSFGVVLSELDTQMLPYRYNKETSRTESIGHTESMSPKSLPNAVLIQRVVSGNIQSQFSEEAEVKATAMVSLGRACMAMDPTSRPNASEALFCLQKFSKTLNS